MSTIRCKKCSDQITSKHRHDFVTCKCGSVSVDGGSHYRRVLWHGDKGPMEEWIEFIGDEKGEE